MFKKILAATVLTLLTLTACSSPETEPFTSEDWLEVYEKYPELIPDEQLREERIAALEKNIEKERKAALPPEIPYGFTDRNNGLATKWVTEEEGCDHGSCAVLKVYAYQSCSRSVYAKVNVLDDSGTVVDWTNGTLGSLSEGDYGLLTFRLTSKKGSSVKLTELNCY